MTAPVWWYRDIYPGDDGDDVLIVQRKLACDPTGVMDDRTTARVRGLQRKNGLEESGIVSEKEAEKLGEKASKGNTPDWYHRTLEEGDHGDDVTALRRALGQADKPVHFDDTLADAVRRFQSSVGLRPTGRLTKRTATALADRRA